MFGKLGRPPEDRLARQREIYEAVSPLIVAMGARKLSMRDAAHVACLSIGGLYHYFPTKRDLVLHGLDLDARSRLCREYRAELATLRTWEMERYLTAYTDFTVGMFCFMRPAVLAALDLGVAELQAQLDAGLTYNVTELIETLYLLAPGVPMEQHAMLGRAIRRLGLGTLIDRHTDFAELRAQLRALLDAYLFSPARVPIAVSA